MTKTLNMTPRLQLEVPLETGLSVSVRKQLNAIQKTKVSQSGRNWLRDSIDGYQLLTWTCKFCLKINEQYRSKNPDLKMRFTDLITSNRAKYPALLFLRRGRYYLFNDQAYYDDVETLFKFAIENYEKTLFHGQIPSEPSIFLILWKGLLAIIDKYSDFVNKILMKDQSAGKVNYVSLIVGYVIPISIILFVI